MSLPRLRKRMYRILAGLMVVWLSGVVFLFCCERIAGMTVAMESHALAKVPGHCEKAKKHKKISRIAEGGGEQCVVCGFLPAVFDKSRKIEPSQRDMTATARPAAVRFSPPLAINHTPVSHAFQPQIRGQNKIFIQNCIFRI